MATAIQFSNISNPPIPPKIKIVNKTVTFSFVKIPSLPSLIKTLPHYLKPTLTKRNLRITMPEAKVVACLYKTGKVVMFGSQDNSQMAANSLALFIGTTIKDQVKICNMVAIYKHPALICLHQLYIKLLKLGEDTSYEPELFPALSWNSKKARMQCFRSGVVIINKIKSIEQAQEAIAQFSEMCIQ
jgi:TATA-box binding protein (TBP) (component of TFIID and TFIIIB)